MKKILTLALALGFAAVEVVSMRIVAKINNNVGFDSDPDDWWASGAMTFTTSDEEVDYLNGLDDAGTLYSTEDTNFRSLLIDQWDSLGVTEVRISICKDDTVQKQVTFDASSSDVGDWLEVEKITSSDWEDLNADTDFQYDGIHINWVRYFGVWYNSGSCSIDEAWFVGVGWNNCQSDWGEHDNTIFYSPLDTVAMFSENVAVGDSMIIELTYPGCCDTGALVVAPGGATAAPSKGPTAAPSKGPTLEPTVAPSRCDSADIVGVNWHDMFHGDGDEGDLLQSYAVNFDSAAFSLTVSATVEYVGLSADGNTDEAFNLGTTYWIDFQSFAGISGNITAAGSCGNRLAADYSALNFSEFWSYTVDPSDLEGALAAERMAYPESDWNLTSSDCNTVQYEKTFSLAQLTKCTDADGETLVNVEESNDTISFQGTFFVELVSPYSMSSSDYYRTFSLLQYEFDIQLGRSVDVLSSTGVLLFSTSATGIGHDDDGNYVLRILTQSADFISLDAGAVVAAPVAVSGITIAEETSSCFVHSSNVCGQIFVVTIPSDIDCTVSDGTEVIDLSGTFQMGFTPQCREIDGAVEDMCTAWTDSLDDSGSLVLDLDWQFVDRTCGVNLFDATFSANLSFYSDDQFSTAVADDGAFVIAQDTIYGEVEVTVPSDDDLYDLVAVSIENVFVCTSDDDTDLSSTLSASDGLGGCLSSDVDVDGLYTVIGSGANTEYQGSTAHDASANNVVRFSFLAFETARTTISVHIGVLLTVRTETGRRRLRMLLEDVGSNQIRHFIGSTNVAQPAEEGFAVEMVVGTGIGGAVIVGIMVFVVVLLVKKRKSGSVVKEPAMTNVVQSQSNIIHSPSTSGIVTV